LIQSRLSSAVPIPDGDAGAGRTPGAAPVDAIAGVPGNPPSAPDGQSAGGASARTRPAANATPEPVVLAPRRRAQAATPLVSIAE